MIGSIIGPIIGLTTPGGGGGVPAVLPDYKWTNNYIAGAGGVQTLVADIGGVNFVQNTATEQPQDGGDKLEFDGIDDNMIGSGLATIPTVGVTLMARITRGVDDKFTIIATGSATTSGMLFALDTNRFGIFQSGWSFDTLNSVPRTDTTICATISPSEVNFYVDGVFSSTVLKGTTSISGPAPIDLGFSRSFGGFELAGDFTEGRIYNQELNATEVLTAYNEMNP